MAMDMRAGLPLHLLRQDIGYSRRHMKYPKSFLEQLRNGGVMVIPFGDDKVQQMVRITKISKDEIKQEVFDSFKFVPLLKGKIN